MATLLLIGGTGFFGKSILDAFKRGLLNEWSIDRVIVMARRPQALLDEVPELVSSSIELYQADISNATVLPESDYIIHAAASTDASKYLSQGEEEKENIIMGALNYCRLAPKYHHNSKIVFCSSGAVYGYQPDYVDYLDESMDFGNVEGLSEVKRAYAYAKRDSEKAFLALGEKEGMSVSIARCFAFVGKYLPREQHFAIGNFIGDGLANRSIVVKAKNKVYRSYMYADDLVMWLMTICENSSTKSPVYNVGSDQIVELHELAETLADNFKVSLSMSELTSSNTDRYVPSIKKITSELKLKLSYDLSTAIELSCRSI